MPNASFRSTFALPLALALLAWSGSAQAQCLGDANSDTRVSVDEIILVVNNALSSCSPETGLEGRVLRNYADLLYLDYRDTEAAAEALKKEIDAFVASPSFVRLEAAKAAWLMARPSYLQTEMARFYEGPIDNAENGPEGRINAWPLDESFIDYVQGNANAGIINDPGTYPTLSKELLAGLNEQGGEDNIATGYHAIEFLLWGQDLSADRNGNRPYTDYVTGAGGTAANQARRGQYLKIVAEMLVEDLHSVLLQWDPGIPGNYRSSFINLPIQVALGRILTGLGTLSGFELSGERMGVALETQDQEDEHSCFSDNTVNDFIYDQRGIRNAYLGQYGSLDGPGIDELVRAVDADLDTQMKNQLDKTVTDIDQIPAPFDQAIKGADSAPGRQAIIRSLNDLHDQTSLIEDIAQALGVDITTTQ